MVSLSPISPEGFCSDPAGMAVPSIGPFSPPTSNNSSPSEDPSKKIRKPYTITKSRESWTDPEHDKFLEALQLFDRDWKKIEAFVGSKTVIQIRSHAQKYFLKAQKSGTNEHLPPPRPKRKAAHPYPQKASKNAPVIPELQSLPAPHDGAGLVPMLDSSLQGNPVTSSSVSSWTDNSAQTVSLPHMTKGERKAAGQLVPNHYCSSTESTPRTRPPGEMIDQGNPVPSLRVLPDFAQVYSFLGSVFDPNTSGHLQTLKKMDPIDVETVLLLMRNLTVNLASSDFEDHRKLLSSYEIDIEKDNSDGFPNTLCDNRSECATQHGG